MQAEAGPRRIDAIATHPIAELLACPADTSTLLAESAQSITFAPGDILFKQDSPCRGLYLMVAGQLVRRAERRDKHLTLGAARPGDLVEIAAALADRHHTYSLVAQTSGSLLLLPIEPLHQAFQSFPPLRMRLLEELAREVSRGYRSCVLSFQVKRRRRSAKIRSS
jgi:CRP-like cAMP-binding protein